MSPSSSPFHSTACLCVCVFILRAPYKQMLLRIYCLRLLKAKFGLCQVTFCVCIPCPWSWAPQPVCGARGPHGGRRRRWVARHGRAVCGWAATARRWAAASSAPWWEAWPDACQCPSGTWWTPSAASDALATGAEGMVGAGATEKRHISRDKTWHITDESVLLKQFFFPGKPLRCYTIVWCSLKTIVLKLY